MQDILEKCIASNLKRVYRIDPALVSSTSGIFYFIYSSYMSKQSLINFYGNFI